MPRRLKITIPHIPAARRSHKAAECIAPLSKLGYTFIDYPENTQRRFFRKGSPRTHHLHIVAQGSAEMCDHLDFRDALRADAGLHRRYAELKHELAARYPEDIDAYVAGKDVFIKEMDCRAAAWRQSTIETGEVTCSSSI